MTIGSELQPELATRRPYSREFGKSVDWLLMGEEMKQGKVRNRHLLGLGQPHSALHHRIFTS